MSKWTVLLALLLIPVPGSGQSEQCANCLLGLFDDIELTQPFVEGSGASKDIYLGIKLADGFVGFTGVEFSIQGLEDFIVSHEVLQDPIIALGTPLAPLDSLFGTGGMNIAWADCVIGVT